jgi:hypothetical protein
MKRSAFPVVLRVYGLVRMCLRPSSRAGVAKREGLIATAGVGHHSGHGDAEACVIGDGGFEEPRGAVGSLVWQDLGEGDARSVIDAEVDQFQPEPSPRARRLLWPLRSPVMRCPTCSKRPSFLMSRSIISPG